MSDLWSSRPFVSHSGPDSDGVRQEVLVTKGCGNVTEISDGEHSVNVTIEIPSLQYPVHGWINKTERNSDKLTPAFKIIQDAQSSGNPIEFRIESQRRKKNKRTKDDIDPKTPIYTLMGADKDGHNKSMEMSNANTKKLLVGVGVPGGKMEFSQALTNPNEDPAGPGGGPTSALNNPAIQSAPATSYAPAPVSGGYIERQPWIDRNPNGDVNPGCYGVETELDFIFWISKTAKENGVEFDMKHTTILAKLLTKIADDLQLKIYNGEMEDVNRNIGSYTRARWLIKNVIENYLPISNNLLKSKADLTNWAERVKSRSLLLWRESLSDYEELIESKSEENVSEDKVDEMTDSNEDEEDVLDDEEEDDDLEF